MSFPEFFIRKPVIAIVLSLLLMIVGVFSFLKLEVRVWPSHDIPAIRITTNYSGASAALIERAVTNILEQELSSVPGIQDMRSDSKKNTSTITLHLLENANSAEVLSQVREVVSRAGRQLPDDADTPVVVKFSLSSEVGEYVLQSNTIPLPKLMDYANLHIQPSLQSIADVAAINIWGYGDYEMQINLDPQKMAANHVSINELANAIRSANVSLAGGQVRSVMMNYPLNINTRLNQPSDYQQIVIRNDQGHLTRVGDVAQVVLGSTEDALEMKYNHQRVVYINVEPVPNANVVSAYSDLTKRMALIQKHLPGDMHIFNAFNEVKYLIASIHEVYVAIIVAIFCVLAVVFVFLGDWRSVLIPFVCIPVSLLAAFFLMKLGGLSINQFTLLALVLAVGLVVDDAIVVLENIQRYLKRGLSSFEASIKGSSQIVFPVIAMTVTLMAVYAPIALITGRYASIYWQFAITLTSCVLISGWVSLTLSPLMCAHTLKNSQNRWQKTTDAFLESLSDWYKHMLAQVMQKRLWVLLVVVVLVCAGGFAWHRLDRAIAPAENYGILMINFQLKEGANISATSMQSDRIAQWAEKKFPGDRVFQITSDSGDNAGAVNVLTPDNAAHPVNFLKQLPEINRDILKIPGARISAVVPSFFSNPHDAQVEFYISSAQDYGYLQDQAQKVIKKLRATGLVTQAHTDLVFNSQQYQIDVNYALASDLGITNQAINDNLNAMFEGNHVSTFNYLNQSYDVVIRTPAAFRNDIHSLSRIGIPSASGDIVPLSQLLSVKSVIDQPVLRHFNRLRSAKIQASLAPGVSLGQVAKLIDNHMSQWLPDDVSFRLSGNLKSLSDSSHNMSYLFAMAVVFIYLLLAMQFGNFIDPLAVMFTVPLCVFGAILSLWSVGGSFNLYTTIALVTLVGLITKHGILIVDFSNHYRKEHQSSILTAVIEASAVRLRPILMTTSAMICGAIPLILSSGPGSVARLQMGMVIIGGLLIGTFFSLIVVPVAYSYLSVLKDRWSVVRG